jgi:ankyrin repeat protein
MASANGHIEIIKLLIESKIEINSVNNSGNTALRIFYINTNNYFILFFI